MNYYGISGKEFYRRQQFGQESNVQWAEGNLRKFNTERIRPVLYKLNAMWKKKTLSEKDEIN
jgi:hypothetical protein